MEREPDEFKLDRDGGSDKIKRAMYSPQLYRRENIRAVGQNKPEKSLWPVILAVLLGGSIGYVVSHFLFGS